MSKTTSSHPPAEPISVAIAGSTERTVICGQALWQDPRFQISWVLTPAAKPVGRKQELTPSPLASWAENHQLPVITVTHKIDQSVKEMVTQANQAAPCQLLLVVDFGYLIPSWLLQLPWLAPVNIHPSTLPRWRGSSPGQFVLLRGEQNSAVTVIVMDDQLDHGPIIHQWPLAVEPNWTQTEYYQASFELVHQHLADILSQFTAGELKPTVQPDDSPTPVARKLTKADSQVSWPLIKACMNGETPTTDLVNAETSALLQEVFDHNHSWSATLEQASRAFAPWPGLWTLVPTAKGLQRLHLRQTHIENNRLVLNEVQLEGKNPASFNEIKNVLL